MLLFRYYERWTCLKVGPSCIFSRQIVPTVRYEIDNIPMLRSRTFWTIYVSFVLFLTLNSLVVGLFLIYQLDDDELVQTQERLTSYAKLFYHSAPEFRKDSAPDLAGEARVLNQVFGARFTMIRRDGLVLADSDEDPALMDNHATRPEVLDAKQVGVGKSVRYSVTVKKNMAYVAIPILENGEIVGFSRAGFPLSDINQRMMHLWFIGLISIGMGLFVALLMGLILARWIVFPLNRMTEFADSVAAGNYSQQTPVNAKNEFGQLAGALNTMASQIKLDISMREKAEAALQEAHDDLEQKVTKRTAELTTMNELLKEQIAERQFAEKVLQASEERYRDLIENANDIIYTTDLKGRFTSLNKAGENITGYTSEQAQKITSYHIVVPEHHQLLREMSRLDLDGNTRNSYEVDIITADDQRLTLEVSSRVICHNGKPIEIQGIARDISERKWAEAQLRHNALHDSLTGLPNRSLLLNQLKMAIERKKRHEDYQFAILFLDIDRFKVVNDSLGHIAGDKLLVNLADQLQHCVRSVDIVARFGGDEFAILVEDIQDLNEATQVAERILEELSTPFYIDGQDIFTTVSIGIAFSGTGYGLPQELLRDADTAMYRAKSAGKACYQVFDTQMHVRATHLLKTETDLRRAIERNEFELYYQPIISLETGELVELEALIRWNHPERGLVPPLDFIPIAEETGLIMPIGKWVIEMACRQLKEWQSDGVAAETLLMSVNLSARQLSRVELTEQIREILAETKVAPRCLNLEITESAIMENSDVAESLLHGLKGIGVSLTTDDFGTGYSSLSYLHRFPIDRLKIDRSFVWGINSNPQNGEIVRTILMLARSLNMKVVAEGIEFPEQMRILQELECDFGQGFLFSKPVDHHAAAEIVRQQKFLIPNHRASLALNDLQTTIG